MISHLKLWKPVVGNSSHSFYANLVEFIDRQLGSSPESLSTEQFLRDLEDIWRRHGRSLNPILDIDRNWLDLAIREKCIEFCSRQDYDKCKNCILLALSVISSSASSTTTFLDSDSPLRIMESVFSVTANEAALHSLFDFLEENIDRLAVGLQPNKGKGLVLLKICNDLLRRISKVRYPSLCGRILALITCVFPLAEPSGVNKKGSFNYDNITEFEGKLSINEAVCILESAILAKQSELKLSDLEVGSSDTNNSEVVSAFYVAFWHMLNMANAADLHLNQRDLTLMRKLVDCALIVLNIVQQSEIDMQRLPDDKPDGSLPPNSNDDHQMDTAVKVSPPKSFFPKYLTNNNLFMLQLRDNSFRMTVYVQLYFSLAFIHDKLKEQLPPPSNQTDGSSPSADTKSPSKLTFPTVEDVTWLSHSLNSIENLIESMPNGPDQLEILKSAKFWEDKWVAWKRDGCKSLEKQPVSIDKSPVIFNETPSYAAKFQMGSRALSKLWRQNRADSVGDTSTLHVPNIKAYLEPLCEQLDPAADVEEEYRLSNEDEYVWKALRLAIGECVPLDTNSSVKRNIETLSMRLFDKQFDLYGENNNDFNSDMTPEYDRFDAVENGDSKEVEMEEAASIPPDQKDQYLMDQDDQNGETIQEASNSELLEVEVSMTVDTKIVETSETF